VQELVPSLRGLRKQIAYVLPAGFMYVTL